MMSGLGAVSRRQVVLPILAAPTTSTRANDSSATSRLVMTPGGSLRGAGGSGRPCASVVIRRQPSTSDRHLSGDGVLPRRQVALGGVAPNTPRHAAVRHAEAFRQLPRSRAL